MQKLFSFLKDHGFAIMIIGFVLAIVGLLVYMQTRYTGTAVPKIAFGSTISGFVVYFLGRVMVSLSRREAKRKSQDNEN
jgi:uncharacterized membrane protein